jgi:hypothetical protein
VSLTLTATPWDGPDQSALARQIMTGLEYAGQQDGIAERAAAQIQGPGAKLWPAPVSPFVGSAPVGDWYEGSTGPRRRLERLIAAAAGGPARRRRGRSGAAGSGFHVLLPMRQYKRSLLQMRQVRNFLTHMQQPKDSSRTRHLPRIRKGFNPMSITIQWLPGGRPRKAGPIRTASTRRPTATAPACARCRTPPARPSRFVRAVRRRRRAPSARAPAAASSPPRDGACRRRSMR